MRTFILLALVSFAAADYSAPSISGYGVPSYGAPVHSYSAPITSYGAPLSSYATLRPSYAVRPSYHHGPRHGHAYASTYSPSYTSTYAPAYTSNYAPAYSYASSYAPVISRPAYSHSHSLSYDEPAYADAPSTYNYGYQVRDDYAGLNFGQEESRDGYTTQGSYHVQLPGGSYQNVNYSHSW